MAVDENINKRGNSSSFRGHIALGEGLKFDHDKPRMDLIDASAVEELAAVLAFGAKKYAEDNWRQGISYRRLLGAALRHTYAILRGEDRDKETGLLHAGHLMCCAMFLVWMFHNRKDMDDRWQAPRPSGVGGAAPLPPIDCHSASVQHYDFRDLSA